jgi:hypothetical protein
MTSILVDVDLDDFDLDEILEELEDRYNRNGIRGKNNKKEIDDFIKRMKIDFEDVLPLENLSLLDKMKIDFLTQNLDKIKLQDLESLI